MDGSTAGCKQAFLSAILAFRSCILAFRCVLPASTNARALQKSRPRRLHILNYHTIDGGAVQDLGSFEGFSPVLRM